jgi:hypothetical protein
MSLNDDGTSSIGISLSTGSNLTDNAGNTVSASGNTSVHPSANNSTWYSAMGTSLSANVIADAGASAITDGNGNHNVAQWASTDGCLRSNVTWSGAGSFQALIFNYSTALTLFEDGVLSGSQVTATSDTGYSIYTLGSSLSGTHTYEICETAPANGLYLFVALRIVNGSYNAKPSAKKWFITYGASEAACHGLTDTTTCAWWLIARQLGYADQHVGVAGWPVTPNTFGGASYPTANLRDCASGSIGQCNNGNWPINLSNPPSFLIVVNGGNDALVTTLIGPDYSTAGYFKADSVTMIGNLVTRWTPANNRVHIFDEYYLLAEGGTCPNATAQTTYQAAWQGAGTYYEGLHPTYQVATHATFASSCFPAGDFQGDNLHLNATGQLAWANVMLPYLYGFVANPSVISIQ